MTDEIIVGKNDPIGDMNEIIAIFDGWKLITHLGIDCFVKDGYRRYHYELKYNSDWSWLMPVWYKFVDLRFADPMQQFKHSEMKTTVGYAILYGGIELSHRNLFEAIKWLNKQTTMTDIKSEIMSHTQERAVIKAKCIGCKKVEELTTQQILDAEQTGAPISTCCFMPMVVVSASITPIRKRKTGKHE